MLIKNYFDIDVFFSIVYGYFAFIKAGWRLETFLKLQPCNLEAFLFLGGGSGRPCGRTKC